jgi:hypothetical protein
MARFARLDWGGSGLLGSEGRIAAIFRRRGDASGGYGEAASGEAPFVGVGMGRGEGEFDPAHADADEAGELEEFEADRAACGVGELGMRETDAPDRADQNIGERGEPQPQLIGAHGGGRGAVRRTGRPGIP